MKRREKRKPKECNGSVKRSGKSRPQEIFVFLFSPNGVITAEEVSISEAKKTG